jgi:hypothetical protein
MTITELKLRRHLWLNHGCNKGTENLYGDDGEMQCHKCGSDFFRQSLTRIADNIDKARAEKKDEYCQGCALPERVKELEGKIAEFIYVESHGER